MTAIASIKEENCHKHHKSYTLAEFMKTTSLLRVMRATTAMEAQRDTTIAMKATTAMIVTMAK